MKLFSKSVEGNMQSKSQQSTQDECCCFKIICDPNSASTASCLCISQMRNVLEQIISFYPNDNLIVSMESGDNVSGRPGALISATSSITDAGLFQLVDMHGNPQEAISICRIAAVKVTSAAYNENITYLSAPATLPKGCEANCEATISDYLPIGTNAAIKAGGQTVGQGIVLKDEFSMVVVADKNNNDPVFISNCKAEIIKLNT